MTTKHKVVEIAARRAKVADAIDLRKPYRQIAEELGVSFGTVAGDADWLKSQWRKSYGKADGVFADNAMSLDRWQGKIEADLDSLPVEKRPGAVDTLVRISDQRAKLFALYPKGSADPDIPTGPIEVKIKLIGEGNRPLIDRERYDDGDIEEGNTV